MLNRFEISNKWKKANKPFVNSHKLQDLKNISILNENRFENLIEDMSSESERDN